ncbi:GNAT acetyltransferase [compost metagenome]
MIELESKDYYKVLPLLRQVNINTLFAEVVLHQHISGKVYVDCLDNPRTFYVVHPYGMSLLFGDLGNEAFLDKLYDYVTNQSGVRHQIEWLQTDPAGRWSEVIDSMLLTCNGHLEKEGLLPEEMERKSIIRSTRVNFSFDRDAYFEAKQNFPEHGETIICATKEQFLTQAGSVVPRFFWRDKEHFAREGVGYSLMRDGKVASISFSSCRVGNQLELGIETEEAYRGKGYAFSVCSTLIDYCLEHDLEPVWACRLENKGSYYLAQKLGFRPTVTLPYYRLPVR